MNPDLNDLFDPAAGLSPDDPDLMALLGDDPITAVDDAETLLVEEIAALDGEDLTSALEEPEALDPVRTALRRP